MSVWLKNYIWNIDKVGFNMASTTCFNYFFNPPKMSKKAYIHFWDVSIKDTLRIKTSTIFDSKMHFIV